jgi:hypothetical protein
MNRLFDIFNSKNLKEKSFKKPFCAENKDDTFNFLNSAEAYLRELITTSGIHDKEIAVTNGFSMFC